MRSFFSGLAGLVLMAAVACPALAADEAAAEAEAQDRTVAPLLVRPERPGADLPTYRSDELTVALDVTRKRTQFAARQAKQAYVNALNPQMYFRRQNPVPSERAYDVRRLNLAIVTASQDNVQQFRALERAVSRARLATVEAERARDGRGADPQAAEGRRQAAVRAMLQTVARVDAAVAANNVALLEVMNDVQASMETQDEADIDVTQLDERAPKPPANSRLTVR